MRELLLVGGGGFIGSVARYLLSTAVARVPADSAMRAFPVGTLVVNLLGCFVIGVLAAIGSRGAGWSDDTRRLLFTGLLGGFTTFSAFGLETFSLARDGRWSMAAANIALQTVGGLLAVWAGYRIAA